MKQSQVFILISDTFVSLLWYNISMKTYSYRLSLRYDETLQEKLATLSDDPHLFTRLIHDPQAYQNLHAAMEEAMKATIEFPEIDFETNDAVVIFSIERSGSNCLSIDQIRQEDKVLHVVLQREHGLTMDIGYFLIVIATEKTDANKANITVI